MTGKTALVYGGAGALGRAVVSRFLKVPGWSVISVDFSSNDTASSNILLPCEAGSLQDTRALVVASLPISSTKLHALVNVAGGWTGGSASNPDAFLAGLDQMIKQNLYSTAIVASLAATYLAKEESTLVSFIGANAALTPTPGMLAYGASKAATHHLVQSLAAPGSGLPASSVVNAILPITLDTPNNRKWMAGADFSTWTRLEEVADKIVGWANSPDAHTNGKLYTVSTVGGMSTFTSVPGFSHSN